MKVLAERFREKVEHVVTVTENDLDCQPPTEENPLMNPLLGEKTLTKIKKLVVFKIIKF